MRLISFILSITGAITAMFSGTVAGQSFPIRPVTVIMPFAPGASTDIEARLYQQRLMEDLKQPVLIDYKPGAGTSIGTIYVAKSAPDGYTILAITPGFSAYPAFFPLDKLPYDPVRDFAPISLITTRSLLLIGSPSFAARTFKEYVAYAKANPGKINFGTPGIGSSGHFAGAWLHSVINAPATFVHYKSAGAVNLDLAAGRIDASPGLTFVVAPLIKSGKAIAIANLGAERTRFMPDLATVAEQGYPEYDYTSWSGYMAPAKTPPAIVNRLSAAFAFVAKAPEVSQRMAQDNADMVGSTPEVLGKKIAIEYARYRKLVHDTGIKLEQ